MPPHEQYAHCGNGSAANADPKENKYVRNRSINPVFIVCALLGLCAAYILARRQEKFGNERSFSAREAILLGMDLVKLLRQIGDLASRR